MVDRPSGPGTGMPHQLTEYWLHGEGAAKVGWGASGDYDRCIAAIQTAVSKHGAPLADHTIHGLCATLHRMATGARPGHAPGESDGHHH